MDGRTLDGDGIESWPALIVPFNLLLWTWTYPSIVLIVSPNWMGLGWEDITLIHES